MRCTRVLVGLAAMGLTFGAAAIARPPQAGATADPVVNIGDVTAREGDYGTASVKVPVDLTVASATKIKVPYAVRVAADGSADPSDVRIFKGTIVFPAGVTSAAVSVTTVGDTIPEPDQHVEVVLSAPIGPATLGKATGLVTLTDDDSDGVAPSSVQVSIGDVTVVEGDSGVHHAAIPVLLSAPATQVTKIHFAMDCSTASMLTDVKIARSGTITFQIGQRSKSINFTVSADTTPEQIKAITQGIQSQLAGVVVLDQRGDATIDDNDGVLPSVGGYRVPGFVAESLPTTTFDDGQAAGASQQLDVTPAGATGSFPFSAADGVSVVTQSQPSVSSDGRFVAFASAQNDLVPGDSNHLGDVFVRDRQTGTTELISRRLDGTPLLDTDAANAKDPAYWAGAPSISADGRFVVYSTIARVDPAGIVVAHGPSDVYLYDRAAHTTELVSQATDGTVLHGIMPQVSAHGRYVMFANGYGLPNVYVRDRQNRTTTVVFDALSGGMNVAMSANGRFVVASSNGGGCFDNGLDVVDVLDGSIERVDVNDDGQAAAPFQHVVTNFGYGPSISADGRSIAFRSASWNMIPGMTGPTTGYSGGYDESLVHPYVRDLVMKSTTLVGMTPGGPVPSALDMPLALSGDGHRLAVANVSGTGLLYDVATGASTPAGASGAGSPFGTQIGPTSLDADGTTLGYTSEWFVPFGVAGSVYAQHLP